MQCDFDGSLGQIEGTIALSMVSESTRPRGSADDRRCLPSVPPSYASTTSTSRENAGRPATSGTPAQTSDSSSEFEMPRFPGRVATTPWQLPKTRRGEQHHDHILLESGNAAGCGDRDHGSGRPAVVKIATSGGSWKPPPGVLAIAGLLSAISQTDCYAATRSNLADRCGFNNNLQPVSQREPCPLPVFNVSGEGGIDAQSFLPEMVEASRCCHIPRGGRIRYASIAESGARPPECRQDGQLKRKEANVGWARKARAAGSKPRLLLRRRSQKVRNRAASQGALRIATTGPEESGRRTFSCPPQDLAETLYEAANPEQKKEER